MGKKWRKSVEKHVKMLKNGWKLIEIMKKIVENHRKWNKNLKSGKKMPKIE